MKQVDDKGGRGELGGRILVAEADPEIRGYITRLLSDRWAITAVADGRAALQAAHEQSSDLPAEPMTQPRPSAPRAVIQRTVLVVEDEPQVRRMAARALAEAGHRVLEAGDGREAMSMLARAGQGVDLVLTDVAMRGMSGRELADRLRQARPDVRVIFMSGYADDEIVRRGLLEPEQPFVQKPFTPDALVRRFAELTEQWLPPSSRPSS